MQIAEKGDKPDWKGCTWVVESRAELEKAAKIPGASAIEKVGTYGGGEKVTLKDPYGITVSVICGQEAGPQTSRPQKVFPFAG